MATLLPLFAADDDKDPEPHNPYRDLLGANRRDPRARAFQITLALVLGVTAFLTFCVLRPRWTGLYAARKKTKGEANVLPELPDTLFGWIVPLWRITDQQVLASAGLDAFAFLAFFKMAMKFLVVTLFFSVIVIKPVHDANPEEEMPGNKTHHHHGHHHKNKTEVFWDGSMGLPYNGSLPWLPEDLETDYLWMYVVFAYLFSAIAVYLIITETKRVIEVRQEYLGSQSSVTDRTIRLSGIPKDLQDEDRIKEFIESLDIGKVESVTLCRNWKELDDAVTDRTNTLRRLEEAYTVHLGHRRIERSRESLPISQPAPPCPRARDATEAEAEADAEPGDGLLEINGQPHVAPYDRQRPKTRIWYGRFKLRSKQVDSITYYEEKLRQADEKVKELRKKTFAPTPLAFVTLDSVAACQMAIQAVLDPSPQQLMANPSPDPADVVWPNTYLSRRRRMTLSWSITALVVILTVLWAAILVPVAGLLNLDTIGEVFPGLAEALKDHKSVKSLVNGTLPTLIASLLMVAVPYLYYWLSYYQGMISMGDLELSAISKNFFFTFFNFFILFTILGTGANFYEFFKQFSDLMQNLRTVAYSLALSLQGLLDFYTNFIILQGLGLFPFRLLEAGSVSLYPIFRMGAKTPRDYAELVQPPIFSYGFYLPTALLIFIICMVYSVLRSSWQVLLAGLIYFAFGHYCYKYQLLYAMDHQQQATGRAWGMICDRVFVGLIFFQVTTLGQLLLKQALKRSVIMIPLIIATIWISILYGKTYKPLMKFIALRSVKLGEQYRDDPDERDPSAVASPEDGQSTTSGTSALLGDRNVWADDNNVNVPSAAPSMRSARGTKRKFINPSLVVPLEGVWIADKNFVRENGGSSEVVRGEESV